MRLVESVELAGGTAPSRAVFGPHETNLGRGRAISSRHVAYYRRRAAGGAGIIVTETASVDADDWPYERAPLAAECEPGWAALAEACRPYGTLLLAGLGHAGGQGSSAYSQSVLWAPSRFPDPVTREPPAEMEGPQTDAVVTGFADAARRAVRAGTGGVEVDAGAYSLLRQFHSGLTNTRDDSYGADRLRLTREVLAAVRGEIGDGRVLGLRLSCDELAPWAGVTPDQAAEHADQLAGLVDLLVVVRAGPYATGAYRPDGHTPPLFNRELCERIRQVVAGRAAVVLQGSVVDPDAAEDALAGGVCDLVEMTRAQIAEPDLIALVRAGTPERARPCILCNQACQVRDVRNPVVSCVGEPGSGHETDEPPAGGTDPVQRDVLVVGGGPAGLECARVAAGRGHRVRLVERSGVFGGMLRTVAKLPGRERADRLADWLEAECRWLGVELLPGVRAGETDIDEARRRGTAVVLTTGSRPGEPPYDRDAELDGTPVVAADELLAAGAGRLPDGPVVVHDPVGGPVGVGVADWLAAAGRDVALVTPDQVAGTLLAPAGDLAPANTRLQQAGVRRELRSLLRHAGGGHAMLEDVWTGERRRIGCAAVVDCGYRLPAEAPYAARPGTARAGDCVAPRTVLEAVLEGRRRALELSTSLASDLPSLATEGDGGWR